MILTATFLGFPISTTHAINGGVMGGGATKRISAARWGIAGNIVTGWLLTLPAAAAIGAAAYGLMRIPAPARSARSSSPWRCSAPLSPSSSAACAAVQRCWPPEKTPSPGSASYNRSVRYARTARNVAIIMVLALVVAFVPAGGNAVDAILAAITMGFLAGITWMLYVFSRQNQLTLATLNDRSRAILYGALGLVVLLIAGKTKMWESGGGTLLWILLLVASAAAVWKVWMDAQSY